MVSTTGGPNAGNGPQIVLGLVGGPGGAFSLARHPAGAGLGGGRERRTDIAAGAFVCTARVLTGNLVLLSGMVAANQRWRLSLRLSRALTSAVAVGVFGLVYSDVWRLSDAFGWQRLIGTALLSVG